MNPEDQAALDWAQNNQGDPRAAAIMAKLSPKSAPEALGSIGVESGGGDQQINSLKQQQAELIGKASELPATSPNYVKLMGAAKNIGAMIQQMTKPPAKDPNAPSDNELDKQKSFDTIGKDLSYMTGILDQIEPGKGILSRPTAWVQRLGYKMGLNPEVGQYEALVDGLASPVARALFAEKGALAEGDVARAKSLFPEIEGTKDDRAAKIENIINLLNNATGKDWRDQFQKNTSQTGQSAVNPQAKPTYKLVNGQLQKVE